MTITEKYKPYPKYLNSGVEWIGEIPDGWKIKRLKHVFKNMDHKRIPLSAEQRSYMEKKYPYYGASGVIDAVDDYLFDEPLLLVAEDGANLLSRSTPLAFIAKGKYWVNNHAHILKPILGNIIYWEGVMQSFDYTPLISGAAQPKLTAENLSNIFLPLPDELEQSQIATFLDHKTSRIDNLIQKKNQQIELLKEKRSALITHAVTKGLNPNAKMKDSGIEWIGEIPEGWVTQKIKYNSYVKGRIGWQNLRSSEFTDEGPYLVTGMHFKDGSIDWDSCYHITEERYNMAPEIQLKKNDVLITKDGTIGKVAFISNLPDKASLNSHLLVIRPLNNKYFPKFLFHLMTSSVFQNYVSMTQTGTTFFGITQESVVNFDFPLPNFSEQTQIADYLDIETSKIDTLISKVQISIEKLKEYRTALISAAVTGKIDVREWNNEGALCR